MLRSLLRRFFLNPSFQKKSTRMERESARESVCVREREGVSERQREEESWCACMLAKERNTQRETMTANGRGQMKRASVVHDHTVIFFSPCAHTLTHAHSPTQTHAHPHAYAHTLTPSSQRAHLFNMRERKRGRSHFDIFFTSRPLFMGEGAEPTKQEIDYF